MKNQFIVSLLMVLTLGVLNSCTGKTQQAEAESNANSEVVIQAYEDTVSDIIPSIETGAVKDFIQTEKKALDTAVKEAAAIPAVVETTVKNEVQKIEGKVLDVAAGKWDTIEPLSSGIFETAVDSIKTTGKKLDAETILNSTSTTPLPKDATKAVNSANEALKAFGDFGF